MKSVACRHSQLSVVDRPAPKPGTGHVLLKVLRCGICGSDLHMRHHAERMAELSRRVGHVTAATADDEVVFGHEFCGEILDHGPGTKRKLKPGTRVCAVPLIRLGSEIDMIGLSERAPGAYAEQLVVQETLLEPIPNGLDSDSAALTEPMAVALHAVRRSEIKRGEVAIVIGCGPVGLAVIAMLRARGVESIVASDYSPARRELAVRCGATVAVDPKLESAYAGWQKHGFVGTMAGLLELGVGTREKLGRLPVPWWHAWRLAEALGVEPKRPVVFECVGVPGVLQSILEGAPLFSRVIVVGVCMQPDTVEPSLAIFKELDLRFVMGYSPLEYRDALHLLADGKVDAKPLVTGTVGLDGVDAAFTALGTPERHAKILIDPARAGAAIG